MRKIGTSVVVAAAWLAVAAPGFAAEQTAIDKCEDLAKQFKMQNVGHVDRFVLQDARRKLNRGQSMCKSNPGEGVKAILEAFQAINVRPKQ
jgi:hypothetical protein